MSHGEIALVHNGIIENHEQQRERLRALGYAFESQTDTEVIAHLIHHYRSQGATLLGALQTAVRELDGAYAIAVIDKRDPARMVAARMGCPLLVGLGDGENFVASDVSAIVSSTRRVIFLEEGDTAELTREGVQVFDADGAAARARGAPVATCRWPSLELGPYRHFMQKEIHEQPRAIADTIEALVGVGAFAPELFGADADAGAARHRQRADPRLRHQLLRRPHRALLDRGDGRHPVHGRGRQRIPLSRRRRRTRGSWSSPFRSRAKRSTRWRR